MMGLLQLQPELRITLPLDMCLDVSGESNVSPVDSVDYRD